MREAEVRRFLMKRKTLVLCSLFAAMFILAGQAVMAQTPRVTVKDQAVGNGTVTVRLVVSNGPGWIVIHADQGGKPGPVVGHAVVHNGRNRNVTVAVDTEKLTDTLYAMLHTDSGKMGTYEFPNGDPPVKNDGQIVVVPFTVTRSTSKTY